MIDRPRASLPAARASRPAAAARSAALALGAALLLAGCRTVTPLGEYTWVHDYEDPETPSDSYVIVAGDLLGVRVWNQEGMSGRARVRADGMISLPFLNDIPAAGVSPPTLATRIQARLQEFIVNPVVTVSLEEPRPFEVSVVGEVVRAGVYKLEQQKAGVLAALASAGGLNDFADRDRIFVLRSGVRIRFTFRALSQAHPKAASFLLRPGDVVVVE